MLNKLNLDNRIKDIIKETVNIIIDSLHTKKLEIFLFGSMAKGNARNNSDIDIGILVKDTKKLEKNPHFESKLALRIEKELKIKTPLDIRVLNNAGLRFINQVLKYGRLVFSRNEKERVIFETTSISNYFDFRPFLKEYEKIREQRFGL